MRIKLIISLLLVSHALFSQSIQDQIKNYTNTRSDLIAKSRALLLDKYLAGDIESVKEISEYIIDSLENKDYIGLNSGEKMLIFYYLGKYDAIIDVYKEADSLSANKIYSTAIYPGFDLLSAELQEKSTADYNLLADNIDATNFSDEKKGFLHLSLQYLLLDKDEQFTTQNDLNILANKFIDNYPDSEYNSYIKKWIRIEYVASDWGWGFNIYGGYGVFTGELSDYYSNPGIFGFGLDITYKQLWFNTNFTFRFNKTKKDINFTYQGDNYAWRKNSSAIGGVIDLDMGYAIYEDNYIKLIPFGLIGYAGADATTSDSEDFPELKKAGYGSFAYGVGCNIDFKLGSLVTNSQSKTSDYYGIRLRYSYNFENSGSIKGRFHNITLGLIFFGHPIQLRK